MSVAKDQLYKHIHSEFEGASFVTFMSMIGMLVCIPATVGTLAYGIALRNVEHLTIALAFGVLAGMCFALWRKAKHKRATLQAQLQKQLTDQVAAEAAQAAQEATQAARIRAADALRKAAGIKP